MGVFRRHPLTLFVVFAVAIVLSVMAAFMAAVASDPKLGELMQDFFAWLERRRAYANIATIAEFSLGAPLFFLVLVFAAAPSIAAVLIAALAGRLGELNGRVRLWSGVPIRQGIAVYVWLMCFFIAGLFFHLAWAGASYDRAIENLGGALAMIVPMALIGMLIDEGGSLEELGWRGFALPLLQERMTPIVATLLLGVIWWAWHLPREIPTLLAGVNVATAVQAQGIFLLLCLALSILMTYAVNLTGGSVWPAVLIHGGTNVWSKAIGSPALGIPLSLRDIIVVGAAALVIFIAGPRLGRSTG